MRGLLWVLVVMLNHNWFWQFCLQLVLSCQHCSSYSIYSFFSLLDTTFLLSVQSVVMRITLSQTNLDPDNHLTLFLIMLGCIVSIVIIVTSFSHRWYQINIFLWLYLGVLLEKHLYDASETLGVLVLSHMYADQLVSQLSYDNQQYKLLLGTVLLDEYLFSLNVFPYTLIDACFSI